MIIAVVRVEKGHPWIWFVVGAGIYFFSLIGISRRPLMNASVMWVVYFIVLIVFGSIIMKKTSDKKYEQNYKESVEEVYKQTPIKADNSQPVNRGHVWICTQCGNTNPEHHFICKCGRKKSENTGG